MGRPRGGGNSAEQAVEALLDAAERSLIERGYRGSTMEVIARDANYTRTMVYRHFATRAELMKAMTLRYTARQAARLFERFDDTADAATKIVEALALVATELVDDPIYAVLGEQTDDAIVANLLARNPSLAAAVAAMLDTEQRRSGPFLRNGVRSIDAAYFLMVSALTMLSGLVPGTGDAEQIRRYIKVFILPAIIADTPAAVAVFESS